MAARSSGGAYPLTFLSGSSRCISAVQLGTKADGICQHGAPTLMARARPALSPALSPAVSPTVRGVASEMACGVRAAGHGAALQDARAHVRPRAAMCRVRAAERAGVRG